MNVISPSTDGTSGLSFTVDHATWAVPYVGLLADGDGDVSPETVPDEPPLPAVLQYASPPMTSASMQVPATTKESQRFESSRLTSERFRCI